MIHRYTIRKINLWPLAKFGFGLGGVAMLLPGVLCAWVGTQGVSFLHYWLKTWQSTGKLDLGPLEIAGFDLVAMFGLTEVQATLTRLNDQIGVVALLLVLLNVIGGGLLVGLTIMLVGWGYNLLAALTGGLEVELHEHEGGR